MGSEILGLLCGCGFGLVVMTVVGHGIWVAIASVVKSLDSSGDSRKPANVPCPQCGSRLGMNGGRCTNCGAVPHVAPGATLREELKTTARQMRRLVDAKAITQEQYEAILAPIQVELQRLAPQRSDFAALDAQLSPTPTPNAPLAPPPLPTAPAVFEPTIRAPVAAASSTANEPLDALVVEPVQPTETAPAAPRKPPVVRPPATPPENPFAPAASSPFVAPPTAQHPLDPTPPHVAVIPPPAPLKPARTLADVLQSFMEESNIRWGEILAALLIVTSAVGLVISLRATLQSIPYFPAFLFTLFTVAFHGAGMYTLRRWNLQAVSRVILIISLLLVPLTFSAAVVMSGSGESQRPSTDPLFLLAVAMGAGIFGWVSHSASRELVGEAKWRLAIGVLGASLSQIVIQRTNVFALQFWGLQLIAGLPLACFLVATGGQLWRARDWTRLSHGRGSQVFLVLGIATFALLAPLALLFVRAHDRWHVLGQLSPALSLGAAAILALGLLIHHRATGKRLATMQTAGTAILVGGGLLLLLLVVAAWPEPELLLAVALLNAALLVGLALASRLALLHAPAIACLAIAALIGLHLFQGRFADRTHLDHDIVRSALMARSSLVLTLMAGLAAAVGLRLRRRNLAEDGLVYVGGAGVLALVSLLIAIFAGFIPSLGFPLDRDLAAPILLLYAVLLLVAAPKTPWPAVAGVGSFLLWGALVQATDFNGTIQGWLALAHLLPERGIFTATLVHGLLTAAIALVATRSGWRASASDFARAASLPNQRLLATPLAIGSAISLCLVLPMIVYVWTGEFRWHAGYALVAAVAWGLLAVAQRWPWAVNGLQVMLGFAPAMLVAGLWYERLGAGWLVSEPHVQSQLLLIAGWGVAWSVARRFADRSDQLRPLIHPPWPGIDQMLLAVAVLTIPVLESAGSVRDIGWELGFVLPAAPNHALPTADPFGVDRRSQLLLVALLCAVLVSLWERVTVAGLVAPGVITFAAIWTLAQMWHGANSVASAARWWAAIYAVLWAMPFLLRNQLWRGAKRLPWLRWSKLPPDLVNWIGGQPLLLGGLPVLILTILAVEQGVAGRVPRGPASDTIFALLGPTTSYAGPLLALVAIFLAYAIRERRAAFALAGSGVFQLAINLAFLLYANTPPSQPAIVRGVEWLQWNSLAAGAFALVWLSLGRWITPADGAEARREDPTTTRLLLDIQLTLAALTGGGLAVLAAWLIFTDPGGIQGVLPVLGSTLSYLAIGLASAAAIWHFRSRKIRGLGDISLWLGMGLVPLIAASANYLDPGGRWVAYHVVEAGWLAVGLLGVMAASCQANSLSEPARQRLARWRPNHLSVLAVLLLLATLAIRGNGSDPAQPWWSLATSAGAAFLAAVLGLSRRSQPYAWLSVALVGLATILMLAAPAVWPWWSLWFGSAPPLAMFDVLAIANLLAAGFWLAMEVRWQRSRTESLDPRWAGPRVHAAVILAAIGASGFFHALLLIPVSWWETPGDKIAAVLEVLILGLVLAAAAWDRRAIWWIPAGYAMGIVALLLAVNLATPIPVVGGEGRIAVLILAAAGHVALTGQLWSYGANLALIGTRLGVSDPIGGLASTARWLPAVNLLVGLLACLAALPAVLNLPEPQWRVAAAFTPALVGWGAVCLAQEGRRAPLQLTALLLAGLAAVYLGWANIEPSFTREIWLDRAFRLLMVLAALTFVYGLALPRWLLTSGSWNAATRQAGYVAAVAAIGTFLAVLALEVSLFRPGQDAPIDGVQIAAIAVVLVGLIAGLLSLALLPGRDPLALSEKSRQWYVYAAEGVAVLLLAHLYICRPTWFDKVLQPYWPLIVMGIAFLGVGAGELCQRWKIRVLAEPLARTGALLPLLPALGIWIVGSQTDYALLLFVVGLLYLVLSITQKSWASLIAAAVAGNGALWVLLSHQDFSFTANPQFWLIPPALSVLIAAQVNRRRLDPAALTAIRYAATIVIYLSSTSEIFLRGIGDSLWPPMLLATLAVIGAFVGIVLRIRAFLYLGSAFTLLAMVSMVAHAARAIEHVWPWWAFGIGLGIAILVLFGIFEKNRPQMLALIARLRQWEQ
ncbi:MAG: hypothetical protein SFU86_13470 [Pirellulaceae bacterium]|nr:hypothetical protein [Pirellulaceae bacterium]